MTYKVDWALKANDLLVFSSKWRSVCVCNIHSLGKDQYIASHRAEKTVDEKYVVHNQLPKRQP